MINQEIYEAVEIIDPTKMLKNALDVCAILYPNYNDSHLSDIMGNPLNDAVAVRNLMRSTLVNDIEQFLNIHGVYMDNAEALDVYTDLASGILEMTDVNSDNAGIIVDSVYDDDPELSVATISATFSRELRVEDFLEAIDHVDPFYIEKLVNALDEVVSGVPVTLPRKAMARIKTFSDKFPNNVAMAYLNHGGMIGGSAETYLTLLVSKDDNDPYTENALSNPPINLVAVHLLAGYNMEDAKSLSISYLSERFTYPTSMLLKMTSIINKMG